MSAYVTCKTQFKDRDALVAALQTMFAHVEVHETPQHLVGYHGDMRPETAHVIVRRQYVGGASNDLGWIRGPDGTYSQIVSDFDSRATFPPSRQNQLKARYARIVVEKTARAKGYSVVSEKSEAGKTKLVLRRFA